MRSHEDYLELAAVATSGDLTEKERTLLEAHTAECDACRQALKEFEAAVEIGVPLLSSKLGSDPVKLEDSTAESSTRAFAFAHGNGQPSVGVNWGAVWLPFAASILLSLALATYAYRAGKSHQASVMSVSPLTPASHSTVDLESLEEQISDATHERELLTAQATERERLITSLRQQIAKQSASLAEMNAAQANLERSVENDESEKQRLSQERTVLAAKLDVAQTSVEQLQSALETARNQRSQGQTQDASLEAQILDLNKELRDREQTINKQEDLLSHDRDIRDLMGARDLYIAEVYDVDHNATTAKPCGRLFYTKGKSLVFYVYDLDKQPGVQAAKTFQAWGRRGADLHEALNLGVFYEDSATKKRWVLKFDDPKTLEQIDAVFVTVEPDGGSHKPSGKPLLFAYLKVDPNHP